MDAAVLAVAILCLLVVVAFVVYISNKAYTMATKVENITQLPGHNHDNVAVLRALARSMTTVLSGESIKREWAILKSTVEAVVSDQRERNVPDAMILGRLIVHMIREPRDCENPELLDGLVSLANSGYRIAWATADSGFNSRLSHALDDITANPASVLDQCRVVLMTTEERSIPIDFSVAMPFRKDRTATYIHFPNDPGLEVVLKITKPSLLAGRFDRLALQILTRIDPGDSDDWKMIKDQATTDIQGARA